MIADKDRSGWFGASDTHTILGKWTSKTFAKWWVEKMGISSKHIETVPMLAGTHFEHRILDALGKPIEKDKQILIPELKVRVNLDGNDDTTIYEVKTYNYEKGFDISKHKAYIEQVNVQMYATHLKGCILAYGLKASDYTNFLAPIEMDRFASLSIDYDKALIEKWLSRVRYLAWCLDEGKFPTIEEYEKWHSINFIQQG